MQEQQDKRALRPMQASAPFPAGGPAGSFCPLSSTFPVVKQQRTPCAEEAGAKRKNAEEDMEGAKRHKPDVADYQSSHAVDELMGRPAPAPASDFSNLNALLGRGQPASGSALLGTSKGPGLPGGGLTTFLDITKTTQQQQGPVGADAMAATKLSFLSRQFSRPLEQQPASQQLQPTQPVASTSGAQPAAGNEFRSHTCVPYDWALKRYMRFISPQRFTVYEESTRMSMRQVLRAQEAAAQGPWDMLTAPEKLQAALVSWAYPESAWEAEAIAALATGKPSLVSLLNQRLDVWRRAFISAYMAVRHGRSSGLYLISPEGARNPTSILFAAAGTRGMQAPHALMSCSSKGQRSKMQAGGLTFTMPLAPKEASPAVQGAAVQQAGSTKGGAEGEGADGMQPQQQQAQRGVAGVRDHSPQSLLLFTGSRAVHMLFDWLLSETSFQAQSIGEAAQDVPMILAPLPFEGATLRKPLVKSMALAAAAPGQQQATTSHMLEVSGPLPPWTLTRTCAAMQEAVAASIQPFTADVGTYDFCLGLNLWPAGSSNQGGGMAAAGAGALDGAGSSLVPYEGSAAAAAPPALGQRVVRSVAYEPPGAGGGSNGGSQGCFVVRTS